MKKIAALMVFVMVAALAAPALAGYRTGSAAGDAVAYGAGGAAVGGGAYAVVAWIFGLACPPAALAGAAVIGGAYLGWYGATDSNKDIVNDVEKTVWAGAHGAMVGLGASDLIEKGGKAVIQAAW